MHMQDSHLMSTVPKQSVPLSSHAAVEALSHSLFPSRFGYFRTEDFAYVITNLQIPRPWVNVMSNGRYGLVVSHTGGGFSWLDNSQIFRITRWEQDLALDEYGRFVYIGEPSAGELWSTTFKPTRIHAKEERVVHGLGFTEFDRTIRGIHSHHTVTVNCEGQSEIHTIKLANTRTTPVELTLGTYLDWHLGSIGDWHREFHRLFTTVSAQKNVVTAFKRPGLIENERHATSPSKVGFSAVVGVDAIDWFTDKADWLGPLGSQAQPDALVKQAPPVRTERWDDPIAGARFCVRLEPGEVRTFVWVIGVAETVEEAHERAEAWTVPTLLEQQALSRDRAAREATSLNLETSDPCCNLLVNAWLPHQACVGRMLARSAYYQQGGAYGFRDQLQDSLCQLDKIPGLTLEQIERNASQTYEDGGVRHWWHPNTDIYAASRHSDTCLWVPFATLEYLTETADLTALERELPILNRESQAECSRSSLLDHCLRGIERTLDLRSSRGLPLIGAGDWNDGLSHAGLDGKGESVWVAMFLHTILNRFAPILESIGCSDRAETYRHEADALRKAVNDHAWDGEWFIAGTSDDGRPFGSSENQEGRIFLNTQTWAVLSGITTPERQARALQSVREHLLKSYGPLLLSPAFQNVDPFIGYITRYAPGLRENGGVYTHAATWAVQAFAEAGYVDEAYSIFRALCPPLRSASDADLYAAEPFVMPGNSDGPDSPHEGRAGWTWYTGSAAWMRRAFLSSIVGVRAQLGGLEITNRLPEGLEFVRLSRPFRGDTFCIEMRRTAPSKDPLKLSSTGTGATHRVEID